MMGLRKAPATELHGLLDDQRAALLAGDLTSLEHMAPSLEATLLRVANHGASRDEAEALRAKAARNAELIQAAQSGVAQVRSKLSEVRDTALTTYDASGRSSSDLSAASRTIGMK
ncbi:hypothetical protein V8J82_07240 [Gymnodinialimonas sp. 2305UL16-5]|uniref:hypothetical protein n=1 Tax=Gymnodinialimonas mytili TaxID=3126503 RepID=UPI0030A93B47